jgi:hypothetical protein
MCDTTISFRRTDTFTGTIEVTVNLFTLFTMERVVRIHALQHPWLTHLKRNLMKYLGQGAEYTIWK